MIYRLLNLNDFFAAHTLIYVLVERFNWNQKFLLNFFMKLDFFRSISL
jgi:hypothetical protein